MVFLLVCLVLELFSMLNKLRCLSNLALFFFFLILVLSFCMIVLCLWLSIFLDLVCCR